MPGWLRASHRVLLADGVNGAGSGPAVLTELFLFDLSGVELISRLIIGIGLAHI